MAKLLTKEKKRAILLKIFPPIGYFFIKLLYLSCKKVYHTPESLPSSPFIVGLWHEYILFGPLMFTNTMPKEDRCSVIISEHFDGNMIAKVVNLFGLGDVRGSSTRGGIKAIKESFKLLNKNECIAITPDGPKGPRHSVAEGIISISQKKDVNIVAYSYKASSFWRLKSWDKFLIPKPFSRVDFYISEPFSLKGLSVDEAKKVIKKRLSENV